LIFKLKKIFTIVTKQAALTGRSTVLSLPLQLVFPGQSIGRKLKRKSKKMILSKMKNFRKRKAKPGSKRPQHFYTFHWLSFSQGTLIERGRSIPLTP
jgi:hypothetical protein